jgi:hypothetical protein
LLFVSHYSLVVLDVTLEQLPTTDNEMEGDVQEIEDSSPRNPEFAEVHGSLWEMGTVIYISWPHEKLRQKRVLVQLFNNERRKIFWGLFARVNDDGRLGVVGLDTPVLWIPLTKNVVTFID